MSDTLPNPEIFETLIPELSETLPALPDSERPEVPIETPIISFQHVSMWFGDRRILDDVSFTVMRGQTLCILGRSGVGKSVALRILMGFLKPQVGSISVGRRRDQRLERRGNAGDSQARDHGLSERGRCLTRSACARSGLSAARHGGLDEDQIQQIVDRLIKMVGAEDVAEAYPASLSTGRKRAVAIARALAAQPEVGATTSQPPWWIRSLPGALATLIQRFADATGVHQHCRDPRYAFCRTAGRRGAVPGRGQGAVLRAAQGVHSLHRPAYPAIPGFWTRMYYPRNELFRV